MSPRRIPTPESKAADAKRAREWRLANPERTKEIQRKSQMKHRAKRREESRKWRERNREYLNDYQKMKYRRNPQIYIEGERRRNRALRLEVLKHYSNGTMKCACCSERNHHFLCIDHVNNDGNVHRKTMRAAGMSFYKWIRAQGFPSYPRLQVICANCNFAKMRLGYCPHQSPKRKDMLESIRVGTELTRSMVLE